MSDKVVWYTCKEAARYARIIKFYGFSCHENGEDER